VLQAFNVSVVLASGARLSAVEFSRTPSSAALAQGAPLLSF
jgi:hypothetical protein